MLLSMNDIKGLIEMKATIEAVKKAYMAYNRGLVEQPPIVSIEIPERHGEIDIKAGYSKEEEIIAVKSAAGFYDNPRLRGLPSGMAVISLYDAHTGYPVCLMDGSVITAYRTGAAGGISAMCLARKDSKTVGVIGSGQQARMQVKALKEVLPIKLVKVFSRNDTGAVGYKREIEASMQLEVVQCKTAEMAVKDSDILVTATPGKVPVVEAAWINPGIHIIAIGADMAGKQEIEAAAFKNAKIVVDNINQCIERGETQNPIKQGIISRDNIHAEIGEILLNQKSGRCSENEITIFDSTGMSVQDIATATYIYHKAQEAGIGRYIEIQ